MKQNVDIVIDSKGREGVFQDMADYILESLDLLDTLIEQSKQGNYK